MTRKLGKRPARHDSRTLRMGAPLARALPTIPLSANWAPDATWPMWNNDTIGCCTQVSVASAIRTWTGAAQAPVLLTDQQVIANYSAESGYNGTPASDQGAVELDVLNHWCRDGYERLGQTRDFLTAFGSIRPTDRQSIQRAIAFLGGVYIGLSLPQYAVEGDDDWTWSAQNDNTPIGGHAVFVHGYDADWLYLNTWGATRRMSWQFLQFFCDEAYGLVSRENWMGVDGVSPKGEALDALVAEMRASVSA